ncbi:MAG: hypothetical protein P8Y47_07330 [Alphaproteobacteria bacterium]
MHEMHACKGGFAEEMGAFEQGRAGEDEIREIGVGGKLCVCEIGLCFGQPFAGFVVLPFTEPIGLPLASLFKCFFLLENL